MNPSVLERLAQVNPDLEVWWDSSPLVFRSFVTETVTAAPPGQRQLLGDELSRIFAIDDPAGSLIRGCTTNPPLALTAVKDNLPFWNDWVTRLLERESDLSKSECAWLVYKEVLRQGAEMVLPIWERSSGKYGYISGQLDPRLITEADQMVTMAREIRAIAPNVMVKVPASAQGVGVVRKLTALGIPTNTTTCFTLPQIWAAALAARDGLADAKAANVDMSKWRAVITMMIGRLTEHPVLDEQAARRGISLSRVEKHWLGIHVFRKAYRLLHDNGLPSKMLACSMRPGPLVGGTEHFWDVEKLAGDIVYTMPPYVLGPLWRDCHDLRFDEQITLNDTPPEVLRKLEKIPYVLQSWDENGMELDQFNSHPATVSTASAFSAAFDGLEAFADKHLRARMRTQRGKTEPAIRTKTAVRESGEPNLTRRVRQT